MEAKLRVLYIGSDESIVRLLRLAFDTPSDTLLHVHEIGEALSLLSGQRFDRVVLEARIGPLTPEALLEQILRSAPRVRVFILAPQPDYGESVRLARLGARGYLPLAEARSLGAGQLSDIIRQLGGADFDGDKTEFRQTAHIGELVGTSPAMESVAELVRLIAPRQATVLITGRTGTGKELVARAIHRASKRANRPMVPVNCGAIPENLMEAELFGHVKGAFTGAIAPRMGRFEQADGGTIFLDEIGELPHEMQSKLLRVLQEREVQRIGGSHTIRVDIRVIAATNRDLTKMVQTGAFREDLYYRLNVVPIAVPSLSERTEDIPSLVEHILAKICEREQLSPKQAGPEAIARLMEYGWPGNVRQLENGIEKAVALSGSRRILYPSDFPVPLSPVQPASTLVPDVKLPAEGLNLDSVVTQLEIHLLKQALDRAGGNKTRAADMLGLKRTTFAAKLRTLEEKEAVYNAHGER